MTLKGLLEAAMLAGYQRAGEETGYWGIRFLQAVRRKGGFNTAKRMLQPRRKGQRAGLDALVRLNRVDLSLENIVLQPRFRRLFTATELAEAKQRLQEIRKEARTEARRRERIYPDELEPGRTYVEGARRQVRVNAYERDRRARAACIRHHGARCQVCDLELWNVSENDRG